MPAQKTVVTEDRTYKPSSPEMPERRFLVETETYRWEVYVSRYVVRETGTAIYHAVVENEHSAYGMTANESVNDLAAIMALKAETFTCSARTISLSEVQSRIDPCDFEREYAKAHEGRHHGSILKKIFG